MHIKNNKGQSTVEYVLLVTAVVAVMIAFATNNQSGFQSQLNKTLNTATGDMSSAVSDLGTFRGAQANKTGSNSPLYSLPVTASDSSTGSTAPSSAPGVGTT